MPPDFRSFSPVQPQVGARFLLGLGGVEVKEHLRQVEGAEMDAGGFFVFRGAFGAEIQRLLQLADDPLDVDRGFPLLTDVAQHTSQFSEKKIEIFHPIVIFFNNTVKCDSEKARRRAEIFRRHRAGTRKKQKESENG